MPSEVKITSAQEFLGKRVRIDYGPNQIAEGVVTEVQRFDLKLDEYGPWYNTRGARKVEIINVE